MEVIILIKVSFNFKLTFLRFISARRWGGGGYGGGGRGGYGGGGGGYGGNSGKSFYNGGARPAGPTGTSAGASFYGGGAPYTNGSTGRY